MLDNNNTKAERKKKNEGNNGQKGAKVEEEKEKKEKEYKWVSLSSPAPAADLVLNQAHFLQSPDVAMNSPQHGTLGSHCPVRQLTHSWPPSHSCSNMFYSLFGKYLLTPRHHGLGMTQRTDF